MGTDRQMNRQVHGSENARLFSLSVFLMNTPAFMNTLLLTLNLINSGPVSLSLRQLIFHIQASFSPDESAHTKLPLCFNVLYANSVVAVLPSSDNTAGSVSEHMGHLSRNSQSKAKSWNSLFFLLQERARPRESDPKNGSGIGKSILWVYCT